MARGGEGDGQVVAAPIQEEEGKDLGKILAVTP